MSFLSGQLLQAQGARLTSSGEKWKLLPTVALSRRRELHHQEGSTVCLQEKKRKEKYPTDENNQNYRLNVDKLVKEVSPSRSMTSVKKK